MDDHHITAEASFEVVVGEVSLQEPARRLPQSGPGQAGMDGQEGLVQCIQFLVQKLPFPLALGPCVSQLKPLASTLEPTCAGKAGTELRRSLC